MDFQNFPSLLRVNNKMLRTLSKTTFLQPSQPILRNLLRHYSIRPEVKTLIDEAVKNNNVCVFMKGTPQTPMCGFSRAVCQILDLQGVKEKKTFNVLQDDDIRNGIKEYTSWPTIPQVFIKGEFVGGCDILISMHQSGELKDLLKKKGIVLESSEKEEVPASAQ